MKQLFEDYGEIDHVINLIEEQRNDRGLYEMRTAKYLAELLRNELLEDGITTLEQIADANEIVYWYLGKKVSPDMWQYVFADCLAALLIYFDEPLGDTNDVHEKLERSIQLEDLRDSCVKVLHADQSRTRAANINQLIPLARIGDKTKTGGIKGAEIAHGDQASKDATREQWQNWVNAEIKKHPKNSFENIKGIVAKKHPVSVHQLKRYTKDTRKKT